MQATDKETSHVASLTEAIGTDDMITPHSESRENILDTCGMACPGPIKKTNEEIAKLNDGDTLTIHASDQGFYRDIDAWCKSTGNLIISKQMHDGIVTARVKKMQSKIPTHTISKNENTFVVFSGDMDRVMAAFIMANGATAMKRKVNMFFTFWGLNAIRKKDANPVKKDVLSKMFGMMLPNGASKLKLSKLNMGGIGTSMMKHVMKKKGVDSLEKLIQDAQHSGVRLVACQMSMDVMGITKDELIDGIEFGGVATFLSDAENSNTTLFI